MNLIKYCEEKYHPSVCNTIQIGTSGYYRNSSNKFISDLEEGMVKNIKFQGGKYGMELPNWIGNIMFEEGMTKNIKLDKFAELTFILKTQLFNSYIFSCSIEKEEIHKDIQKNLNYDSHYEIKNIRKFTNIITSLLTKDLKEKNANLDYLDLKSEPVQYLENNIQTFTTIPKLHDFYLVKRNKFSFQKEFRFCWIPMDKRNYTITGFPEDPVLIPITDALRKCIICNS